MNWIAIILICLGVLVAMGVAGTISARRTARSWVSKHLPEDDAAFLERCQIAQNDEEQRLALAVRRALAAVSGVPPGSIAANVRVIELSEGLDVRWDDWQDVRFRVKRLTGFKIDSKTWFNNPLLLEVEREKLEFQHVVRAALASCADTMEKK